MTSSEEYFKSYYQKNKERLAKYWSAEVTCECGTTLRRSSLNAHRKSQRHHLTMAAKEAAQQKSEILQALGQLASRVTVQPSA